MFASELKSRIDEACNQHMIFHKTSGEMSLLPELKIAVAYYDFDGKFYGYGDAVAYYDPSLDRLVIEQPPNMIHGT